MAVKQFMKGPLLPCLTYVLNLNLDDIVAKRRSPKRRTDTLSTISVKSKQRTM